MNIQCLNDFLYLNQTYNQPYFVIDFHPTIDIEYTPLNCYMFLNKISFDNGEMYLQSYGLDISNDIIFNNDLVAQKVSELLTEISPLSNFIYNIN
jgi:hypothetical protein